MSKQFLAFFREINAGENASVIKSPPIHLVMLRQSLRARLQSNIDLLNILEQTHIEIMSGLIGEGKGATEISATC